MKKNKQPDGMPVWFDGKNINEALFCDEFLQTHKIIFTNGAFFTPEGRVTDELPLRGEIFEELKCCAVSNIPRKISNIVELMKLAALVEDFPPEPDRIHLSNGTLFLDGRFVEGKPEIVRNRFPMAYNPNAPKPVLWLQFLDDLLYPEDIPTLQEYIGYCLIPSNKGQRMMVIKGNGGEGKSQIGAVLGVLFGSNMKDGSIGKISENRFARADLEHILLCVDDDIEAHNERTKEKYASNPDVDISRSKYNFHLIEPQRKYRAEAERQIKEAGCRTRSDSVRVVEALVTATPEFFQGNKKSEIRTYFQEALTFLQQNQDPKTIISAVVHMDEKTPHMHLSFVPLTADGRLSAKEIVGNKKKLTQWQDKFWKHMVRKYPDLERGESASQTGRDHIPPRVFKEMTRLTKQKAKLEELLAGIGAFNAKSRAAKIAALLDKYIPAVEQMHSTMKKYQVAFTETTVENKRLKQENAQLEQSLEKATQESTLKQLADAKLRRDYADAVAVLDRIPKEVFDVYARDSHGRKERPIEQNL